MCVCLASVCVRACAHVCPCVRVCVVSFNAASDEVLPTVNQSAAASSQVFSNGSMTMGSSETRHSAVLEMQTAGILYLRTCVHTYVRTYIWDCSVPLHIGLFCLLLPLGDRASLAWLALTDGGLLQWMFNHSALVVIVTTQMYTHTLSLQSALFIRLIWDNLNLQ